MYSIWRVRVGVVSWILILECLLDIGKHRYYLLCIIMMQITALNTCYAEKSAENNACGILDRWRVWRIFWTVPDFSFCGDINNSGLFFP